MDMPTSEQLKELKEIVVPIVALFSLFLNLVSGYFQSQCRRDLNRAYAEISFLTTGKRVMRKGWQFWKRKKNRTMVVVPPLDSKIDKVG